MRRVQTAMAHFYEPPHHSRRLAQAKCLSRFVAMIT